METTARKTYMSDVSDEEWAFVAPYLTLLDPDAPQRRHDLREVFDALRWIVRASSPWRMLPTNFPPWAAVPHQTRALDLGRLLRGHGPRPAGAPAPGSGMRSGPHGGDPRRPDAAVDPGERGAGRLRRGRSHEGQQGPPGGRHAGAAAGAARHPGHCAQGYTGADPALDVADHGIRLEVGKLEQAKRGFVLLPRRWVVERSFAWATRFRRLAKDDERLPETVAGLHFVAFACLMLQRIALLPSTSP